MGAEVPAVRNLLTALLEARQAYQQHQRNHPHLIERHNTLLEALNACLADSTQIRLDVASSAILHAGEPVHEDADPNGLPGRLHHHGIREIHFTRGVPSWELASFIDALNTDYADSLDDDLVTTLWERDLAHIRLETTQVPDGAQWASEPVGTLGEFLQQGRELPGERKYVNIHRLEQRKQPVSADAQLAAVRLTNDELGQLAEMDRTDRDRDVALDVLNVLLQTIQESGSGDEQMLEILGSAVREHDSPSVRAAALKKAAAIRTIEIDDLRELVVHALGDESAEVRRAACQLAPAIAHNRVTVTLASLLRDDTFGSWQPEDKRAAAVAYGLSARDEGLELLEETLLKTKTDVDRVAAAAGLVVIRTEAADELIRRLSAADATLGPIIERARAAVGQSENGSTEP